jgi:hypothetical protein
MQSYLSGITTTSILLDTFSISSGAPLPLCSIPQETYITALACGDSILSAYIHSGAMPKFTSMRPNPVSQGELEVTIEMPETLVASIVLTDANGKTVSTPCTEKIFTKGKHTERIDIRLLASGVYAIRLLAKSGEEITERFVVTK